MFKNKQNNEIALIDFGGSENNKSLIKIYSNETNLGTSKVISNHTMCLLIMAIY